MLPRLASLGLCGLITLECGLLMRVQVDFGICVCSLLASVFLG